jgi:hypothetical protein
MINRKMAMLVSVALLAVVGSVVPAVASCYYSTIASASGYMTGSGDEDVWTMDLVKGVRYNVQLSVGYGDDFDVRVYYRVQTLVGWEYVWEYIEVASGLKGTGVDESAYFTAPRNTTYFFVVTSWIGSGNYTLRIKRQYCN